MAPSVLGKRARATESTKGHLSIPQVALLSANLLPPDLSSISSRVKRRTISSVVNDENVDPETTPNGRNYYRLSDSLSPGQLTKVAIKLAKCTPVKESIALSPAKYNGRIKTSETAPSRLICFL